MPRKYKHLKRMVDRHGRARVYLNRPGKAPVALPPEDDPAFVEAYRAAMGLEPLDAIPPPVEVEADTPSPKGSFNDLCARFYVSERFLTLKAITKATYRNVIENMRNDHGLKPIALLDGRGIRAVLSPYADRPAARNQRLKLLRILMDFAIEEEDRDDNPCLSIKRLKAKSDEGLKTWQEEEIALFLRRHERGTKAHLALLLALNTGQRRSDLVRMGWHMIRRGRLCVTQSKTGVYLEIPLAQDFLADLELICPKDAMAFLVTGFGKPFEPAGFGNWFRDRCVEAALPLGFNAHGLRKAVCRRLAEAGCTTHEIASISGHKSLAEIERYTKRADQRRLAGNAMDRIGAGGGLPKNFQPDRSGFESGGKYPRIINGTEALLALPTGISNRNDHKGLGLKAVGFLPAVSH